MIDFDLTLCTDDDEGKVCNVGRIVKWSKGLILFLICKSRGLKSSSLIAKILQAKFFHIARPYHGFCTINQLEALVPPPSLPPLMRSWSNRMLPPVISLAFPHSSMVPINTPGLSEAL